VANLGKEFQDLANQKFIEIKEAYTIMMEDK
jgi:DnaJ-class molecular chaperone